MKRTHLYILIFILTFFLAGCSHRDTPVETTVAPPPTESTAPTTAPATLPVATELPTQPEHSELYIPGLSADDVIRYFNEVCLDAEYIHSGDASRLQKWTRPIQYTLYGSYTEEDLATLTRFTDWLNTVEGFPGISEAEDPTFATLRIHFCTQEEMLSLMGDSFTGLDGAVTFWYEDDRIYDAIICCRTDLDQQLRNSVILEELYNGLGPIQDTALRPDSIIASEFSQPQSLTEIDELILCLLYHPQIMCGMDAESCEAVIRQLYY